MEIKKTILITGASSGIGNIVAQHLNKIGYRVALVSRNKHKLDELKNKLTNDTLSIPYDLQDLDNINKIFEILGTENVKLYGLIHCAGINRDQPLKTNSITDMINVINVNLLSFIELCKYFSSKRYSVDGGAIVAMSSTAVYGCDKSMCTYSASKAGVDASVRVISKELARRKIRVNSIQPTYVNTEMAKATSDYEAKIRALPLGVIEPEYIAYLIEFLLSEKSKYISGSNIKMSSAQI